MDTEPCIYCGTDTFVIGEEPFRQFAVHTPPTPEHKRPQDENCIGSGKSAEKPIGDVPLSGSMRFQCTCSGNCKNCGNHKSTVTESG